MIARRIALTTVWTGVFLLALIGVLASVGRGISVMQILQSPQSPRPELSRFDSLNIINAAPMYGVEPGSAKYQEIDAETRRFVRKFSKYPGTTLLHILPAALFMILAPFQFSRRIRSRHLRLHRPGSLVLPRAARAVPGTTLYTSNFGGEAWERFINEILLSHFPAGGSVSVAAGWWRWPNGRIVRGDGKTLVMLAPATQVQSHRVAVQAVITAIKQRFDQMSVGWEEDRVCAGF